MDKDLGNLSLKFFPLNVLLIKGSVSEKAKTTTISNKNVILHFQDLFWLKLTYLFLCSLRTWSVQQ